MLLIVEVLGRHAIGNSVLVVIIWEEVVWTETEDSLGVWLKDHLILDRPRSGDVALGTFENLTFIVGLLINNIFVRVWHTIDPILLIVDPTSCYHSIVLLKFVDRANPRTGHRLFLLSLHLGLEHWVCDLAFNHRHLLLSDRRLFLLHRFFCNDLLRVYFEPCHATLDSIVIFFHNLRCVQGTEWTVRRIILLSCYHIDWWTSQEMLSFNVREG